MTSGEAEIGRVGTWGIVLRGMFLACSWTWCIGMFFPVFFVGDFGVWGWVAFAVPNVIGAGAMGWVLRRPGAAERLTRDHTAAARWFSIVTVLFHVSFGAWFFEVGVGDFLPFGGIAGLVIVGVMVIAGAALASLSSAAWYRFAPLVWLLSVLMGAGGALTGSTMGIAATPPRHEAWELAFTIPTLVFGFALCPYLDLTFLRVRRETPGTTGASAFWIGFIAFFAPMIAMTLLYSKGLIDSNSLSLYIVGHVFVQATFTVGAHLRELFHFGIIRASDPFLPSAPARAARHAAVALALLLLASMSVLLVHAPEVRPGYPAHRLVYELFMSFYALVFPAYVWIVVIERGQPRTTRLALYLVALALAAPCLWLGYIEQRYIWLLPAVAIPLILPLLGKLPRRSAASRR